MRAGSRSRRCPPSPSSGFRSAAGISSMVAGPGSISTSGISTMPGSARASLSRHPSSVLSAGGLAILSLALLDGLRFFLSLALLDGLRFFLSLALFDGLRFLAITKPPSVYMGVAQRWVVLDSALGILVFLFPH